MGEVSGEVHEVELSTEVDGPRVSAESPKAIVNGAWHVDRSVIRLLDGTRAYLSAVIDNYSRRILAWHLADNALALPTAQVIAEAAKNVIAGVDEVAVIVDKGGENRSSEVNVLFEPPTALTRFVAQVDLDFSNRATRDRRGLVFQRTLR